MANTTEFSLDKRIQDVQEAISAKLATLEKTRNIAQGYNRWSMIDQIEFQDERDTLLRLKTGLICLIKEEANVYEVINTFLL